MNKILIVEDDKNISNMICELLKLNNYESIVAFDSVQAIEKHDKSVDLILLDLMLPKGNGKNIIKKLKEINNCPVIVVSSISDVDMKVLLFDLGADDYITKPFQNKELLARMKLILKRNQKEKILQYKDLKIDTEKYIAICNEKELELTKNEFEILTLLILNSNQIVTKTVLFDNVWGTKDSADDNTLNVHISKLRNKLKSANPNEEYIETIWKIGYKLK
ncbi:MAG: response regulator transcription factor [Clostridia bacterium]|nr:response regulator transcription factor [Clostridia bacterium]